MLGFDRAEGTSETSLFGNVPEDFAMDEVYCSGTEDSLFDCEFTDDHNCTPLEGAGVFCV